MLPLDQSSYIDVVPCFIAHKHIVTAIYFDTCYSEESS